MWQVDESATGSVNFFGPQDGESAERIPIAGNSLKASASRPQLLRRPSRL
jgi:hypothetical protein